MGNDSEDQRWLDAMGGKLSDPASLSKAEQEAALIRRAMLRRLEAQPNFEPSEVRLDMLVAEANRQGLLKKEKSQWGMNVFITRIYRVLAMPSGVLTSCALVLGLSFMVGYQANEISPSESQIVRKGDSVERVPQIVSSPLEAAQAWQKELLAAGVEYGVSYEEPQRILIRIRLTPPAIELLETRSRIQAPPGEWVTLVIEAERKAAP